MSNYVFRETPAPAGAPLFFVFHGTGGDENQFAGLASELLPEAHVVAPRGDVSEHGALRYFRRKAEGVYDMDDLRTRTAAMAKFVSVHKERVGAARVVGLGYSNGANILASVMMQEPGLFSETILMHPLIPWQPQPVAGLSSRRVLITAGKRDPICPPAMTQALADWFKVQGAATELVWHDSGHELRPSEISAAKAFLESAHSP
jgi:phospholipase/carboxylesterase